MKLKTNFEIIILILMLIFGSMIMGGRITENAVAKCGINTTPYNKIERMLGGIDHIKCIDKYHKWYCYYVFAHGDVYVITVAHNKIDIVQQLN